jgi:Uncharacterized protein conserved in bacteria
MNGRNFQKELDERIIKLENTETIPRLLMHSCCGPCSSYCLEYLSNYFKITVFYYNPNIYPEEEYYVRVKEQQKLISLLPQKYKISFQEGHYITKEFYDVVKGLENTGEGKERCFKCYELRLREAMKAAEIGQFDFFTTTLSVSPMKNAKKLTEIGEKIASDSKSKYLPTDFKKKGGYQRSVELSKQYGMYRQDYCGCIFSMKEKEKRDNIKKLM